MADIQTVQDDIARDEQGAVIPIYQKNGDPYLGADGSPSTITVLGSDAKKVRQAKDAIQRRLLQRRQTKLEPADLLRNRVDQAAAAVTAWSGWEANGEPWPCTPENVKALLAAEHILEQVEQGIAGHSDFFAKPSGT